MSPGIGTLKHIEGTVTVNPKDKPVFLGFKLVLDRPQSPRLHVNLQKCDFCQAKVSSVRYEFDVNGLHNLSDKIKAVKEVQPLRIRHSPDYSWA